MLLCGKCATTNSAESKEILVEVDNTIGAKVGDHVEVSMDNMNVLKAAVMAYIIPLIALLVGNNRDLIIYWGQLE